MPISLSGRIACALLFGLVLHAPLGAQVPHVLNYQGYLTSAVGQPVSGTLSLTFNLYSVPTGGAPVYTETQSVSIVNGVFDVAIGAVTPLALKFDSPYYLGVIAGADPEMTPRQLLATAPYALKADSAVELAGAGLLQVVLNGKRVVGYLADATAPIITAGSDFNATAAGASGATISGGGAAGSSIGGLDCNGTCANQVYNLFGTVGGGAGNQAGALGPLGASAFDTVAGGVGNAANGGFAVVAGGQANWAGGSAASVGGGTGNQATGGVSAIGGGYGNKAGDTGATIAGGYGNSAPFVGSTVGGGWSNSANGVRATVAGGYSNVASDYGAVPGGQFNVAGGIGSLAAGTRAKAQADGMFVWADTTNVDFDMNAWRAPGQSANTFNVRATGVGGVYFATAVNTQTGQPTWGCYAQSGSGWTCTSDRNVKRNLRRVDSREVLALVDALPVYRWQPKDGPHADITHLGPMAQDFFAAFGLGDNDKAIGMQDSEGVALAAIQGLHDIVRARERQIAEQAARIARQDQAITALARRLEALEGRALTH